MNTLKVLRARRLTLEQPSFYHKSEYWNFTLGKFPWIYFCVNNN
jgi:hypothetical protein